MSNGVKSPYADDPHTYTWDWCQDSYRDETGKFVETTKLFADFHESLKVKIPPNFDIPEEYRGFPIEEIEVFLTADGSNRILSLNILFKMGDGLVVNHPAWDKIDWEDHSWEPPPPR